MTAGSPDDSAPAFSDPGVAHSSRQSRPEPEVRYRREGLLGVGGMGRVFLARDGLLRRQVALKEAATPELVARLEREASITAQLEHPGIVAVYDAGETDGQAWYVMRLIRGRTLRERLAECVDLQARLRLLPHLVAAAQAVAYAHSMGIVHRDLKPANIMVGAFGETQVADWGLAGPVDEAAVDWAPILGGPKSTAAGTPRYMSPEQAAGGPAVFPSDVFSLGMALYEVLAGRAPPEDAGVAPDLDGLSDAVPPELATVVRRCLHSEPGDRYPSAVALAEDLERWLSGRRVLAHTYRPAELLRRLVRAWRAPLAVAAVAALLLGGVVVAAIQQTRAERAAADAHLSQALARQALAALAHEQLPEAQVLAAHALRLGASPEARGVVAGTARATVRRQNGVALPEVCRRRGVPSTDGSALACASGGRVEVLDLEPASLRRSFPVEAVAEPVWLGDRVAVVTPEGVVWLHDDEVTQAWEGIGSVLPGDNVVFELRSRDVRVLRPGVAPVEFRSCVANLSVQAVVRDSLVVGCDDGVLRSWAADGTLEWSLDLGARPAWSTLVAGTDGLLVGRLDGTVQRLDPHTGTWGPSLPALTGAVTRLVSVPGTDLVAARGARGGLRLGNVAIGEWVASLPASSGGVFPGPGPSELTTVEDELRRWRVPTSLPPGGLRFGSGLSQVAFTDNGGSLVVALGDGDVVRRRLTDGVETGRWELGEGVAKCVAPGPDGLLYAGSMVMGARLLLPDGSTRPPRPARIVRRAGTLADGRVWGLDYEGYAFVSDPHTGDGLVELQGPESFDGASSPSGDTAAILDARGSVHVLSGEGWEERLHLPDAVAVAVGDGGTPLVAAKRRALCPDGACFDIGADVVDVALHGDLVAVGTLSGDVRLFSLDDHTLVAVLEGHRDRVSTVAFDPNGGRLASGSWDKTVRLWDLSDLWTPPSVLVARAEAAGGLDLEAALGAVAPR